nr:MAG TPA: hypothetical protein [Caudoviricetes sp.]DAO13049.1 MAG TPA: hypothetical protein [Caudoviricetes sp.]
MPFFYELLYITIKSRLSLERYNRSLALPIT